jgi:hypothetical protein
MKSHVLYAALLAASTLSACGGDPAPVVPPAAEKPVAEQPSAPAPAPPAGMVPTPAPSPAPTAPGPPPAQESFATKAATAAIPADAIGGSPVANVADAWVRGHEALKKYCGDNAMPCDSFYVKESPQETSGYYTMQFFGAPNNDPMYIGVRIYPDGRAEIVR